MNFDFSEDQKLLQQTARSYLDDFWTIALHNFQRLVAAKKKRV